MSLDAIKNIIDSEESAKKFKEEAISAAKKAVADAEKAGQELVSAAVSRAKAESAELIKKAEGTAEDKASQMAANNENKKAAMRARAQSRLDDAADFIIERIVKD